MVNSEDGTRMAKAFAMSLTLLIGVVASCHAPLDPQSSLLSVTLTTDSATLGVGDSTRLTMVVSNLSSRKVTYEVGAGNWAFDVAIEGPSGGEVWRRSSQPSSVPAVGLTIPPGASVSFQWTLRVDTPGGVNLSAGTYKLRGFLIDSHGDVIATANPVIDVTILPAS